MDLQENLNKLKIFLESDNIVFFGGAGVSTESGIPDFRSRDGLYNQKYKYSPEVILSHDFFMNHTEEFYDFYRNKMLFPKAKPNDAHKKLAELEKLGRLKAVITQNVDGLHQMAGSKNVMELHGSVYRNFCMDCGKFFSRNSDPESIDFVLESTGVPLCDCGGAIKPDVVLYGERLNNTIINEAVRYIAASDVLIIGGTSLGVYPAAVLVDYYRGNKLVLINKSETHVDNRADLVIRYGIGEVLGAV